jgi:hypothetical protein
VGSASLSIHVSFSHTLTLVLTILLVQENAVGASWREAGGEAELSEIAPSITKVKLACCFLKEREGERRR